MYTYTHVSTYIDMYIMIININLYIYKYLLISYICTGTYTCRNSKDVPLGGLLGACKSVQKLQEPSWEPQGPLGRLQEAPGGSQRCPGSLLITSWGLPEDPGGLQKTCNSLQRRQEPSWEPPGARRLWSLREPLEGARRLPGSTSLLFLHIYIYMYTYKHIIHLYIYVYIDTYIDRVLYVCK